MKASQLILIEEEFNLLMNYFLHGKFSVLNKKRLYQELREARIVSKDCLPLNVVCQNSRVVVWNINKNHTFSIHVSVPENLSQQSEEYSMPIGIALLGHKSGSVTEWEMPDGINKFKIISVHQDLIAGCESDSYQT